MTKWQNRHCGAWIEMEQAHSEVHVLNLHSVLPTVMIYPDRAFCFLLQLLSPVVHKEPTWMTI